MSLQIKKMYGKEKKNYIRGVITSCYRDDGARNDDDGDDDCDDETTHIPVRVFKSASRIQSFLSPLTRRHRDTP